MDTSVENIQRLCAIHIARYTRMIASNHPFVRVDECQMYLGIWKAIEAKGYKWIDLNTTEQREIVDAIDGDE